MTECTSGHNSRGSPRRSAVDYLGDVPWNENEAAKVWYARVKSRPSFRPILGETLAGIPPSKTYADLDF